MIHPTSHITCFKNYRRLPGCDYCFIERERTSSGKWQYNFVIPTKLKPISKGYYTSKKEAIQELGRYFDIINLPELAVYRDRFCHKDYDTIYRSKIYGTYLASILERSSSLEDALLKVESAYVGNELEEIKFFLRGLDELLQQKVKNFTEALSLGSSPIDSKHKDTVTEVDDKKADSTLDVVYSNEFCIGDRWRVLISHKNTIVKTNEYKTELEAINSGRNLVEQMKTQKGENILKFFNPCTQEVWEVLYALDDSDPLLRNTTIQRKEWIETYHLNCHIDVETEVINSIISLTLKDEIYPNSEPLTEDEQAMLDEFLDIKSNVGETDFIELANHPKTEGLSIDFIGEDSDYEWNYKGNTSIACFTSAQEAYVDFVGWLIESLTSFQDDSDVMENRIVRALNNDME